MTSDPHSPDRFRIIGPLRNDDDWYKAFKISGGQVLPEARSAHADLVGIRRG